MVTPKVSEPDFVIRGGPSIKQYRILNDKRHILTKDTDNRVSLYDVLKAQRVEDLGPNIDFDIFTNLSPNPSLNIPALSLALARNRAPTLAP